MPSTIVPGVGGPQSTTPTAQQTAIAFNQAAHRGTEISQTYTGIQLGGSGTGSNTVTVGNGPISLQPQGFLRGVLVDLQTTTAATGTPVGNADFPFSIVNLLRLHDTNGATMHEHTGYHNYLLNLFGCGVDGHVNDLSQWPDYSSSATSPSCQFYLPIELDANGFGSLANQSAADTYKLDLVLDSPANVYSTAPTANPVFTVNIHCDYWTLPGAQDMLGRPQQQEPPYHGVAQYTYQSNANTVSAGSGTLKIGFTGNMYRALILTGRAAGSGYATGGARSSAVLPNPYTLRYDTRDLMVGTSREQRRQFFALLDNPSTTFITGVYAFLWNYNGWKNVGGPGFHSWLPTLPATRFELTGTFGAGTVDMLSNTVSVAETNPALRGVSPSATGYSPPVAPTVAGAQ